MQRGRWHSFFTLITQKVTNVRRNILSSLHTPSSYEKLLKALFYMSCESGAAMEGADCGARLLKAELWSLQAAPGHGGQWEGAPIAQPGSSLCAGGCPGPRGYTVWPARREPRSRVSRSGHSVVQKLRVKTQGTQNGQKHRGMESHHPAEQEPVCLERKLRIW